MQDVQGLGLKGRRGFTGFIRSIKFTGSWALGFGVSGVCRILVFFSGWNQSIESLTWLYYGDFLIQNRVLGCYDQLPRRALYAGGGGTVLISDNRAMQMPS